MRNASLLVLLVAGAAVSARGAEPVRLVTLDPGHFHAGLIQKEMYPGVDPTVHVYAPLGPDVLAHLGRVSAFNARAERPTTWRLEVHAGPDFMERMLREKPGNVVVLSGRNKGKMDRIEACVAPEVVLAALERSGLAAPRRAVSLGMFSEYTARR